MNDNGQNQQKTSFIERIAQSIIASITSKTVFGEPIEHNGIKIIPVAKIRYGFGGGFGHKKSNGIGKGGGGGAIAQPIGYIEMKTDVTRFKPIPKLVPLSSVIFTGLVGLLIWKKLS